MSWHSDIAPQVTQKNLLKGLALATLLHFLVLFFIRVDKTWVPSTNLRLPLETKPQLHVRLMTLPEESGGGQGGGEGGGSLSAPIPERVPARPIPVPDAIAPQETLATVPNISPALDSATAGGTGLPGSSWGTGGTGWGIGKGEGGVGLAPVVVVQPRPIFETVPEYPQSARKKNIQGAIELNVKVDATGKVVNVVVLENTTQDEACAQSAIAAAYRTRFRPAQTQVGPDTAWVVRRYRFALNK